jgi:hypothetical protein
MNDSGLRGADLARAILDQVRRLRPGTTCCPSEIARDLAADWRPLMQPIRDQALLLANQGLLSITQGGTQIAGPDIRGPIRLGPAPLIEDRNV